MRGEVEVRLAKASQEKEQLSRRESAPVQARLLPVPVLV